MSSYEVSARSSGPKIEHLGFMVKSWRCVVDEKLPEEGVICHLAGIDMEDTLIQLACTISAPSKSRCLDISQEFALPYG